jgi:hypothetical protein
MVDKNLPSFSLAVKFCSRPAADYYYYYYYDAYTNPTLRTTSRVALFMQVHGSILAPPYSNLSTHLRCYGDFCACWGTDDSREQVS